MRGDLSRKGRAFLVAGTLCIGVGAVGFTQLSVGAVAAPALAHFACGLLFGVGLTLNVASWFVGRRAES